MERRRLEITLMSASNLERVRTVGKMRVHARVSLGGSEVAMAEKRTPPHKQGGANPVWNFPARFDVTPAMLESFNTVLVVKLYCSGALGDRYIGEFNKPIKELFDSATALGGAAVVDFPVQRGSADSQGMLRLAYEFGEKFQTTNIRIANKLFGSDSVLFLVLPLRALRWFAARG